MRAMLAEPDRTWTVPTLARRRGSAEDMEELVAHLRLLGALYEVEPPTRYTHWYRFQKQVRTRRRRTGTSVETPGVYRLAKSGPECLQRLLDDARPTGVPALLFTEGWSAAMAARRLRRRSWSPRVIAWRLRTRERGRR